MEEPELDKEYKSNPFKVPEGYFEGFENKVMDRLAGNSVRMNGWLQVRRWGIAASLLIIAGIGLFLYRDEPDAGWDISKEIVSESELQAFQSETELNDDELMELLNHNVVDSIYRLEVRSASQVSGSGIEAIEEEYTPLDDEIQI